MAGSQVPSNALTAAAAIAEKAQLEETYRLQQSNDYNNRKLVAEEAKKQLSTMLDTLLDMVIQDAPNAKLLKKGEHPVWDRVDRKGIALGDGWLVVDIPYPFLKKGEHSAEWDVLVGGKVHVLVSYTPTRLQRSANIWFGKIGSDDGYRWWEVGYMLRSARWIDYFAKIVMNQNPSNHS